MSLAGAIRHERESEHAQNISNIEMWTAPAQDLDAWNTPLNDTPVTSQDVKRLEHQVHVDHVSDMVPFWMRAIEAAGRGEELKLEAFLETFEDPWGAGAPDNAWGYAFTPGAEVEKAHNGWDEGQWETQSTQVARWAAPNWNDGGDSGSSLHARGTPSPDRGDERQRRKASISHTPKPHGKAKKGGHHLNKSFAFVEDVARQEAADVERKQKMHSFFEMPTQDKVKKIEEMIRHLKHDPSRNA